MTNFIVYDLKTHNTNRIRPYCISFYRLSKIAGRHNRDLTPHEAEKCKNDPIVFDRNNCVGNALAFY